MTRRSAAVVVFIVLAAVLGVLASPAHAKDGEGEGFADMTQILPQLLITTAALVGLLLLTALLAQVTRKRSQAKAR